MMIGKLAKIGQTQANLHPLVLKEIAKHNVEGTQSLDYWLDE